MPWAIPVAMAAGSIYSGIAANNRASGDRQAANEAADAAVKQLINTGYPPDMAKRAILEQYKSAGTLTPDLEKAIGLGPSAVAGIGEDSSLRGAQLAALQQYQQAGQTGQTAQDQMNNLKAVNQVNADNQSRQASILQGTQARGEGGSGPAIAAQLLAAQGAANTESEQGLQLAAQGNSARMQALSQAAGLGGQLRSQDFGVNQAKANAADQFQRFNIQNQQAVVNQNVGVNNQAQAYNLQNAQGIANQNTVASNQETLRQKQGEMQNFQAEMARNQTIANARLGQATQLNDQANQIAGQASQFGTGLSGAAGSGAKAAFKSFGGGNVAGSNSSGDIASSDGYSGSAASNSQYNANMYGAPSANNLAHGGMVKHKEHRPMHNMSHLLGGYLFAQPQHEVEDEPASMEEGSPAAPASTPAMAMGGMMQQQPQMMPYQPAQVMGQQQPMMNMKQGGVVPGHAVMPGDNYANDMVHTMLSPDELVIPRSIMTKDDAPERAMEFVKGVLASRKHNK